MIIERRDQGQSHTSFLKLIGDGAGIRDRPWPGARGAGTTAHGPLLGSGPHRLQRRPVLPVRQGEAMNLVNARYGRQPGLKAYTHVSDRFGPFATQTIPATVNEVPYILDGLLMTRAGRRIREQYADSGGFTDHVFVVTSLLGYQFIPRIRDLPS